MSLLSLLLKWLFLLFQIMSKDFQVSHTSRIKIKQVSWQDKKEAKLVLGPVQHFFYFGQVGSFFWCTSWVRSATSESGKFPTKSPNFQFFPSCQKKSHEVGSKNNRFKGGSAPFLLQVKSMLGAGQGQIDMVL